MTTGNDLAFYHWKRKTTLFLTSQTITLFGSSMVQYAIMWHVTLSTQSGSMMTLMILSAFLPTLLLSPLGGVWADRFNRKSLIMLADGGIALSTLVLAVFFLAGYQDLWMLFLIAAIRAVGAAVQTPTVGAIFPQIVPEKELTRVNGLNASIQSSISILSPIVSAALMAIFPLGIIFLVDVVTAAIGISILLFFVKIPTHKEAASRRKESYLTDFKLGLAYIGSHSYLKKFFGFMAVFMFLVAPVAFLTPLQVTRNFGGEKWQLAAVEIAFALGMVLGGLLLASWGGFRNRMHTMGAAGIVIGISTLLLGFSPIFWLYLAIMLTAGFTLPMFNTPSTVLIQEKVEPEFLGRVFGVLAMISSSVMPLAMLIFGPLADRFPIEWLLWGTGVLLGLLALFLLFNKEMLLAGKPKDY